MLGDMTMFITCTFIYIISLIAEILIKNFLSSISLKFGNKIKVDFMEKSTEYIINQKSHKFSRGQANTILSKEINLLENYIFNLPITILSTIVLIAMSVFALINYINYYSIIIVILCIISTLFRYRFSETLKKGNLSFYNAVISLESKRVEFLDYFKVARLIHAGSFLSERICSGYSDYFLKEYAFFKSKQRINVFSNLNDQALSLGVLIVTGVLVITNNITIGVMIGINKFSSQIFSAVSQLLSSINNVYMNKCELDDIIEIISSHPTEKENINCSCDKIEIKELYFKYSDNFFIFNNVNQVFKKGQINYIVRASGVGKTTLFKLLVGELQPVQGKIISSIDNIYMMPQESIIFCDTIKSNITLGMKFDEKKLISVCKACQIYDDVAHMTCKFDTVISDKAGNISDGQKQRICLARALYLDKPILILDEPTSNIDNNNSRKILSFLHGYAKQHLVIIISHSNYLITDASKKYVIKNLNIVEE